ncbi:MAG: tetratricopeptide repeat protein [Halofilum sp. (in: g-proteobacteria)]|nr:tetratricopeptide repeat protein [Halofilum sp. (in: g-proteobacteria)]
MQDTRSPPPASAQPTAVHEAIAADRRDAPVSVPETLSQRLAEPGAGAAVHGGPDRDAAGLLVAAADGFRAGHPGAFVLFHDAGAGGDAADTACLYRRLLAAIRAHCGLREPLPDTATELGSYLPNWLARAAVGPGAVVAIAGCEHLPAGALGFATGHRPPGLRVLLAADDAAALPPDWPAWDAPAAAAARTGDAIDAALAAVVETADRDAQGVGQDLLALIAAARDGADPEALAEELGVARATVDTALAAAPGALRAAGDAVYPLGAAVTTALAHRAGGAAVAEAHRRWAARYPADAAWHLQRAGDTTAREALLDDPDRFVTLATGPRRGDLLDGWAPERVARAALAAAETPAEDAVRVQRVEAVADVLARLGARERLDDLLRTAAALRERVDGADAPATAAALDRWGAFRLDRGDNDEAAPLLERAHAIRREALGETHPDTEATAHRLARLHEARGDVDAAERAYRGAIERAEAARGDNAALIPHISNLAALRRARGELDTAEPLYRRAQRLAEDELGVDHPTTAAAWDNLGGCLYAGHDLERAEQAYRRALEIAERIFGPAHAATGAALHNLATTLDAQQRFADAEPYYRRALEIRHAALGEDHEDTLSTLHNLAAVLESTARSDEAEQLYRRAVAGWERLVGADHPATATSMNNLADLLRERGALAEAEDLYRRNLETWRKLLGEEHPNTLTTITELGALYADAGQLDTARAFLEQAVDATARIMGRQTLAHIDAVCRLAALLRDSGEKQGARDLLQRTLDAAEGTLGVISPRVQKVRRQLEALDATG